MDKTTKFEYQLNIRHFTKTEVYGYYSTVWHSVLRKKPDLNQNINKIKNELVSYKIWKESRTPGRYYECRLYLV